MEGITGILVFMGVGSILGLIVGNLLWYKDHKRIKLQEEIIEYWQKKADEIQRKYHAHVTHQADAILEKLKKAADKWEAEKDASGAPKKMDSIDERYMILLVKELETVLEEVKLVVEIAPRRFSWIEYKKASLVEPLQQALRQIIYFDRFQESEKGD